MITLLTVKCQFPDYKYHLDHENESDIHQIHERLLAIDKKMSI